MGSDHGSGFIACGHTRHFSQKKAGSLMPHSGLLRSTLDYYLRRLRVAITSTMKVASGMA